MRECKNQYNYFRRHGKRHRRKHLEKRLEAAQESQDIEAENKILAIIKREKDRSFWRRLNYALGRHKRGNSVKEVLEEDRQGNVRECRNQTEV